VTVDIKQRGAIIRCMDHMGLPEFVVECVGHCETTRKMRLSSEK